MAAATLQNFIMSLMVIFDRQISRLAAPGSERTSGHGWRALSC